MKKRLWIKLCSCLIAFCTVAVVGQGSLIPAKAVSLSYWFQSRFYRNAEKYQTNVLPYRLYVPEDYDPSQKYPLVLHLHGAGEQGNDNELPVNYPGIIPQKLLEGSNTRRYPCIIVVPQTPKEKYWIDGYNKPQPQTHMAMAIDLVKELQTEYNIDKRRLYIEGYSDGANGALDTLMRNPGMFAAAVLMCGYTDTYVKNHLDRLDGVPIQIYHSSEDPSMPVKYSDNLYQWLKERGQDVTYHKVPSADHGDAWRAAYNDENLLPWLFSKVNVHIPPEETSTPTVSSSSNWIVNFSSGSQGGVVNPSESQDQPGSTSGNQQGANSRGNVNQNSSQTGNGTIAESSGIQQTTASGPAIQQEDSSGTGPQTEKNPASLLIWILIIAGAAVLVIGATVYFMYLSGKNKNPEGDGDSDDSWGTGSSDQLSDQDPKSEQE